MKGGEIIGSLTVAIYNNEIRQSEQWEHLNFCLVHSLLLVSNLFGGNAQGTAVCHQADPAVPCSPGFKMYL